MKRLSPLLSLLFLMIFWSCCAPNSVNPLSDYKTADYDERLEGTWYGKSETNTGVFLHIGKRKDDGKTQIISVEHKDNGALELVKIDLIMFPTIIRDEYFMNIKVVEISDTSISAEVDYLFIKYKISPENALTFSFIDYEKIKEAVKNGALKGSIPEERKIADHQGNINKYLPSTGCVKITDTSQNIVKYFESMDTDSLFPNPFKFKKVNPSFME